MTGSAYGDAPGRIVAEIAFYIGVDKVLAGGNIEAQRSDELLPVPGIVESHKRIHGCIAFFERHLAELSRRTADIPDDKRPACYIGGVASRGAHGFTSTEPGYPPFLYTNAKNVAALPGEKISAVAQISKEKLLEWDPEILFVDLSTTTAGEQASSLYQLTHDSALSALSAVREGNIWGVLPYNSYTLNYGSVLANGYFVGKTLYLRTAKSVAAYQFQ